MKKIFTLIMCALATMTMQAQDQELIFVDAQGNEIKDGSTITMSEAKKNDFDEIQVSLEGLYVKNTTEDAIDVNMDATVTSLPTGTFACCLGTSCQSASSPKTIHIKNVSIAAGNTLEVSNTEWVPTEGSYGTCTVKLQIGSGLMMDGPTITVNFVYANPDGIETVNSDEPAANNAVRYNLAGQRVKANAKGIIIAGGKKFVK